MGYKVDYVQINDILKELSKEYDIYAPKRFPKQGRYSDTDIVAYDKVVCVEEIVFDEKSDYSAKEVVSPITQSLFYFTEDEYRESKNSSKNILIFLHPCDIHAFQRQDRIFTQNGGFTDLYYQRKRERVKFAMIECNGGYDSCFCVSMNSNVTQDYAIAIHQTESGWVVDVKDEDLRPYFKGEECAFTFDFVQENELKVTPPTIRNKTILNKLKEHPMWNEYDRRCISCGACTIACSTCTCFTTTDISYTDNGAIGERRRTSASCQIPGFTAMAGGHVFRPTTKERMRYKVLHKFHDYKARFKEQHMCVGCGRCIDRCPEFISIAHTVEKMNQAIAEIEQEVASNE